jgi:hypothetical protein
MTPRAEDSVEAFQRLVQCFEGLPGVDTGGRPGRFGANALRVDGHIFAMLRSGGLVLKLPATDVAGLLAAGRGKPFDAGKGIPMREWVVLTSKDQADWQAAARKAMEFVGQSTTRSKSQ